MKRYKLCICILTAVFVICTGVLIAFADQENELEFCDHEYEISAFNHGVVTFECTECGDSYTENFKDHLNERGYEAIDMNSDGIVNGKDYGYLLRDYGNNN